MSLHPQIRRVLGTTLLIAILTIPTLASDSHVGLASDSHVGLTSDSHVGLTSQEYNNPIIDASTWFGNWSFDYIYLPLYWY